jgi:hypothetical protein
MMENLPEAQREDRQLLRDQWRRRTIRALVFSQVVTLLAIGAFVAGVAVYFANFNFGSGGDARGMIVLFAALGLGVIAVIGDLYAIVAACLTWRYAGSPGWLAVSLLLPVLQTLSIAVVRCVL